MKRRRTGSTIPIDGPPDVYTVKRLDDGSMHVKHFPNGTTGRACCTVTVHVTADDLEQAYQFEPMLVKGSVSALARAYATIQRKHDEQQGKAGA